MLRTCIFPITLAAASLALSAATAQAADVAYDVDASVHVQGTANGTDNDGWSSNSSFETEIDQTIRGIASTDDSLVVAADAPANRFSISTLNQSYALVTELKTITWGCTADGQAKGAPGSFRLTRNGDVGVVSLELAKGIVQPRSCSGFSAFTGDITMSTIAPKVVFTFPWSQLATGAVSTQVNQVLPCGEWTVNQVGCTLRMVGGVSIRRYAATPEDPAPHDPDPAPQDPQDPDVPAGPRGATPITLRGHLLRHAQGAKVTVSCGPACTGKVSALAVAKGKQATRSLGSKPFDTGTESSRDVTIIFGKKGGRTARKRGSVIIDVTAGSQSQTLRLDTH